ncbi:MAG: hypothetical protein MJ053_00760 [Elusimicrobiaceae bacterium]|nr:hypothetical protein [Elusimicrobiaceae bacterium]
MTKKLVVVSDIGYFPDSLIWFKEQGFDLYYVELKHIYGHLVDSRSMFRCMGAKWVHVNELDKLYEQLDQDTLVISGPTFAGSVPTVAGSVFDLEKGEPYCPVTMERMETVYTLSKYNHDHKCGAKFVLFFNGDTGFGSQRMVDFFNEKIQYIDVLMFDNDLLREMVLQNSQVARTKQTLIGWLETPLKRHVIHQTKKPKHEILSLGRCLSALEVMKYNKIRLPIIYFPFPNPRPKLKDLIRYMKNKARGLRLSYKLTGLAGSMKKLKRHRQAFLDLESDRAFGLSHMHDVFIGGVERFQKDRAYYLSAEGNLVAQCANTPKELYYPFVNNPNKEACYLMYGIIPLISHAENNYYKTLLEKKMAILIRERQDFYNALAMSDAEIQQYRDNIYANRDLFTFDHVGEMLVDVLNKRM